MWEISNYNQAISFTLSLCVGGVFCVLYDIIRALRKVCMNSFFMVTVTDILLWVFYAFATFIFLMAVTDGEIRGYVLFGELTGFVLFRISVSKLIFPFLRFVFLKISDINKKTTRLIAAFNIKIEWLISKTIKYAFKFFKSIKKLLKNALKLLYTNKNIISTEKSLDEAKTET